MAYNKRIMVLRCDTTSSRNIIKRYVYRKLMRIFLIFFAPCCSLVATAAELDENRGPSEYLHQMIHRSSEIYVVEYKTVVKSTWANGAGDKLEITAVIKHVIKGFKAEGQEVSFSRILDGRYGDISDYVGSSNIVFYQLFNGHSIVDQQDPASVLRYSPEKLQYLREHDET